MTIFGAGSRLLYTLLIAAMDRRGDFGKRGEDLAWWLRRRCRPGVAAAMAALLAAAQALRYWAIATLGERWTTRIICLPRAPLVAGGPYRFLRHPNYLAVVAEMAALPLLHGAWLTAAGFSAANALVLRVRIRHEEAALARFAGAAAAAPASAPASAGN
jgi:methyltransferase